MKPLVTFLLALSAAANLALIAVLFAGRSSEAPAAAPAPQPVSPAAKTASAADTETWTRLNSTDLPVMVQELRDSGFPPEIVRAITAARLRESYAARLKALDPAAGARPFWKNAETDPKLRAASRELYREQQKVLRELLGPDATQSEASFIYQNRRLESVPPEKVDDVKRLLREFEEARSDIYSSAPGMIGPEQQRKVAAIEKEHQEALARLLTPAELEEYNIRNSDTSRNVRYQLSAFNPTEQEFRSIFKLQEQFDQQFGRLYGVPSPDEQQRRSDAQRQLNEQIKAALGPERGAEYERANDFNYRQTSQLVTRLELPPETTTSVWQVQKDIQDRARALQSANTPPEDRRAKLAELANESRTRISALLGDRGFEAYRQYGGSWMQMLQPPEARRNGVSGSIMVAPGR